MMVWLKVIHILCVMGWMTGVFAVPRALIYWRRAHDEGAGGQIGQLTWRIYRFSAMLGTIAVITGLWLAREWSFPVWSHVKIALVTVLALHYGYTGYLTGQARSGRFSKSDLFLRIYNEASVFVAIAILYIVVAKPF